MMITFLTLCGCLLVVGASDCGKQCPILSAAGTVNDELSLSMQQIRNCKDAVEILTTNKKRDERVIKDAIKAAKKVIDLPSPSVNLECDKLIKDE
ncbi:unnamed protein product [Callosobruchus maculatus]|uniref:Uncharacterized protein n=1 Tax=Callosobruchus maculatus TaxID=64391 RepID=A0A653DTB5_CALMS|nr:unnamed protein product [Callosobruchus maculatus]